MLALLLALLTPLTCQLIHSDWISGRDITAAVPALAGLPPELPVGLAPLPGQQRIFRVTDLKRLAVANHLNAEISDSVCFAWNVTVPNRDLMEAAMRKTLTNRQPIIEILETSLLAAPVGEMDFPLSGLALGSPGPALWRGFVRYAENRKFPIWARVRVEVKEQRVTAAVSLQTGDRTIARPDQNRELPGPFAAR